jgi:acetyl-CoA carboxylase carboxyl transferase subunit alpha
LKLTAPDLLSAGIIDAIVREPSGGAHNNPEAAAALVDDALTRTLAEIGAMPSETRLDARYRKFRSMGRAGVDFVDG